MLYQKRDGLLCKHEDLSPFPQTHVEARHDCVSTKTPKMLRVPEASRFSTGQAVKPQKWATSKYKVVAEASQHCWPLSSTCTHTGKHTYLHTHIHTNSIQKKKKQKTLTRHNFVGGIFLSCTARATLHANITDIKYKKKKNVFQGYSP